jgi:hypothetical protein
MTGASKPIFGKSIRSLRIPHSNTIDAEFFLHPPGDLNMVTLTLPFDDPGRAALFFVADTGFIEICLLFEGRAINRTVLHDRDLKLLLQIATHAQHPKRRKRAQV